MGFRGLAVGCCAAAAFCFCAVPAARAADPDTGFFVVGALGLSHFAIDYSGQVASTYSGTPFNVVNAESSDAHDHTYTLYAGYQFHPSFGIEAGYADLGKGKTTYTLSRLGTFLHNGEHRVSATRLSANVHLPVTDAFSILARAGAARTTLKYSETGTSLGQPTSSTATALNQARFTAGLGARYTFGRRLALRLEWDNYFGIGRTFNQGADENGKFDSISTVNLGLEFRF